MRPQSMAQTVRELETAGLVTRHPDPNDRRRVLVEPTEQGRQALENDRTRREGWIAEAISHHLSQQEQKTLIRAVELLQRLTRL